MQIGDTQIGDDKKLWHEEARRLETTESAMAPRRSELRCCGRRCLHAGYHDCLRPREPGHDGVVVDPCDDRCRLETTDAGSSGMESTQIGDVQIGDMQIGDDDQIGDVQIGDTQIGDTQQLPSPVAK